MMYKIHSFKGIVCFVGMLFLATASFGKNQAKEGKSSSIREHLLMDFGWRFAFGNAIDAKKDFNFGTGYFSYLAKAGYGDGPASSGFDDRCWRLLNLPHDWAVEMPFSPKASSSHGYKTVGRGFPETSIGWYRKTFFIPETDLGKRISIQFDGVFRDAKVFVNGFYLGHHSSGYLPFTYDITDYLNYDGNNVVVVRVNATREEGWFYEGAGIYRHVWLDITSPLHVAQYGTFITSTLTKNHSADVMARATLANDGRKKSVFEISQTIIDAKSNLIATRKIANLNLKPGEHKEFYCVLPVKNPELWDVNSPYLYKLITKVVSDDTLTDRYTTTFGIRTVRFDPDKGFFLNGKRLEIKGTNNHQDAAGVGIAVPDAMQVFRIKRLKEMGDNAIRCSHNPPSPALLNACDSLGMLVIDENREVGTNPQQLHQLREMICHDRNHPCVFLWSLGNEEWAIEGNIKGARVIRTMQDYAGRLDSSRAFTAAVSGGWDNGIGMVTQVMGYNYIVQGNIDEHHAKFPWQSGIGTEESNTIGTRGVYITNDSTAHMAPTNRMPQNVGTESGWKFYAARPFLAGLCYWTGFDYRGEPTPYGWPQVSSQFGILDMCGFPKDIFYYLKSWWGKQPVLHISPYWNWNVKEGTSIQVIAYSNCDSVELFLNHKSLGSKIMPVNSHLEWQVPYERGTLLALGFKNGKQIIADSVQTSGPPAAIQLIPDRSVIKADGADVSVITVRMNDAKARFVPDADNEIYFHLAGPGKIIGVGNGDPSSHEKDRFVENNQMVAIDSLTFQLVKSQQDYPDAIKTWNDRYWPSLTTAQGDYNVQPHDSLKACIICGQFYLSSYESNTTIALWPKSLGETENVYINGHLIASHIKRNDPVVRYEINHAILHKGKNIYTVVAIPLEKKYQYENLNTDPGTIQVCTPASTWRRKAFNGLAQVIVQSGKTPGTLTLSATSDDLSTAKIMIQTKPCKSYPEIQSAIQTK
ncbi:beta-galactosidase GalA [Microbacter margulisiae]|uniref:Beta-galactosidase n=1 Tax=Microbacter margulisiae TaxID=1350067 RepID=A0A7W5DRF6_9PORP|nr:beta-galactosidase GalA [Microbacter margulisiae]MBB3187722.1 beta-galactosidase [Microbacter margulisiae]